MFLARSSWRPIVKTLNLNVWALPLIFLHEYTLFVIDMHQNRSISLFSTPSDHFQKCVVDGLILRHLLRCCLMQEGNIRQCHRLPICFFSDLSNSETVAATLWERVQNLWWAWAQKYVLERAVFWRISPPTHMKSILRGLLGSQVHHRGAGRSFSITLPDTSCLKCVGSSICSVLASIGFVLKTRYISAALN